MKKILLISFFLVIIVENIYSQIAYYDAIKLVSYIENNKFKPNSIDSAYAILSKYPNMHISGDINCGVIKNLIDKNPFLKPFLDGCPSSDDYELNKINRLANISKINVSNQTGFNAQTFADGLAKFLVERAKEELNIAFFERFKKELNKEEYSDLKTLFPQTFQIFQVIDKEIYQYASYIQTLREGFEKDLSNLLINSTNVLEKHLTSGNWLSGQPQLKEIFLLALEITRAISNGTPLGDFISTLSNRQSFNSIIPNFTNYLKIADLFSQSLKSKDENRYWVSSSETWQLINNKDAFTIYLGLLYQQIDETIIFNGNNFKTMFEDLAIINPNINTYKEYIQSFIAKAEYVDMYLKEIRNSDKKDLDYNRLVQLSFLIKFDIFDENSIIRLRFLC